MHFLLGYLRIKKTFIKPKLLRNNFLSGLQTISFNLLMITILLIGILILHMIRLYPDIKDICLMLSHKICTQEENLNFQENAMINLMGSHSMAYLLQGIIYQWINILIPVNKLFQVSMVKVQSVVIIQVGE